MGWLYSRHTCYGCHVGDAFSNLPAIAISFPNESLGRARPLLPLHVGRVDYRSYLDPPHHLLTYGIYSVYVIIIGLDLPILLRVDRVGAEIERTRMVYAISVKRDG